MDILILGNGFDLAHGLKTKYSDFLEYCVKQFGRIVVYKPTDKFYNNLWIRHFISVQQKMGEKWIDLEEEIYKVVLHISKLPIMTTLDCHKEFDMHYNDNVFNFYNIEKYLIEPFGRILPENGYARIEPNNELQFKMYFSSPRGFVDFLYEQLREFTKLFNDYLLKEVLEPIQSEPNLKLSLKSIGVNEGSKDVHVLNFNYTDTCERFYRSKFSGYCNLNIKPVYVHGKVSSGEECNLVLGTHGFERYNGIISKDFNIFKKHNQRHKFGTIEPYQDLLRKIKKSRSTPVFHIIGHSLDDTDKNILKHVLLANPDSKINIYYHDEEAQERLMNKIDDIISEEEVMAKVRFINQHDSERGILIPKVESVLVEN